MSARASLAARAIALAPALALVTTLGINTAWVAPATAEEVTLGPLTITDPWARASAGMARAGAAFMTIRNDGTTDRLISASADISDVVELHTHIKDGEVMRMRRVDAIEVTGGTETHLQPGGLHVMFIGLHAPLEEGQTFPLSLTFEAAGTVKVSVTVQGVASMGPGDLPQGGHQGIHQGHGTQGHGTMN